MATIERGKAGTGSVLSLDAIGKQDTFLTSNNNQDSFFKYENIRHSDFAMFERVTTVQNNGSDFWPFGQSVTVTYKPTQMSDLLANIFLVMTLPGLRNVSSDDTFYTDQIGRAIIDKIEFRVDEFILETLENDWNIIHDELYLSEEEKKAIKNLINGGKDNIPGLSSEISEKPIPIILPLKLFFSRKHDTQSTLLEKYYKPYFPLCAITKQEIKLTITFKPYTFFSIWTDFENKLTLDFLDVVTQEIQVSDQERHFLQQHPFEVVYETVKRNPVVDVNGSEKEFKSFLVPGIPVKSIHWFVRRNVYELSSDSTDKPNRCNILNRFNFSLSENLSDRNNLEIDFITSAKSNIYLEQYNPIISDAKIFLNGEQILGFVENANDRTKNDTSNFHKLVQSQKSYLSTPIRNIYTYTFALNPKEPSPTGALDFSSIESQKSFIQCSFMENISESDNFDFYIFFTGYNVIKFANGFLAPKYAIS